MAAVLEIVFPTVFDRERFMTWLDEQGEQYYFEYLQNNGGDNVMLIDYNYPHGKIVVVGSEE